jgi:hypothetical protein
VLRKKLIGLAAAVALGCVPVATNALAAGHPSGGRGGHASAGRAVAGHATASAARGGYAMAGHAHRGRVVRYGGGYGSGYGGGYVNGPIYDSCAGYGYNGCPGYGVAPLVDGVISGVLGGGYRPY